MHDPRQPERPDDGARRNYVIFCLAATLTMTGLITAAVVYLQ